MELALPQKIVMNIAFNIDNNFVEQLAVTITSILLNSNQEDFFNFFVLESGLSDEDKNKIAKLKKIKDFNVEFIGIKDEDFEDCPILYHFKKANYFRLKLSSMLNVDKVLYLDCDVLVEGSLKEIYNTDIKLKYAALVEDILSYRGQYKHVSEPLNVKKYFNSGVMLLNLQKIRQDNIEEKCFKFIKEHPQKIVCADQCVLNYVFKENVVFLDKKFNFQYNLGLEDARKIYKKNKNECVIIHFVWIYKPWTLGCPHPLKYKYYRYLSKTPYKKNFLKVLIKEIFHDKLAVFKKYYLTYKYFLRKTY